MAANNTLLASITAATADSPLISREIPSTSGSNEYEEAAGDNGGSQKLPLSHPNHIVQKLVALMLMCLLGFGAYFCYDNPGALQDYFTNDMSLSTSQFVLLYSWYSWPNVVLCFVGGYLMDKVFGIRLGTVIYALLVVIGQLVFAFGAYLNLFWLTIVGRFIFGAGGESLAVAQNSYAVVWFKGKELNMVFGFQLSFARAGSTVNFLLMEPLYRYIAHYYSGYQCLGISLFIASISCFVSFVSSLLLAWQDKHAERILKRKQAHSDEVVKLSDVKYFPVTFWLTTFTIVFYYGAILPFVALGKVFFERKFDLTPAYANFVNSILFIISAVLSPFLGLIVDKCGKNVTFVFTSLIVTIIGHFMLAFTFINPLISMCVVGVSYAMVASALWPLIALVTPDHLLGTAYGIAQSFENLGLGVIAVVAGLIVDGYGYFILEAYFISCLSLALLSVIVIWIYDTTHTGYLNMSTKERASFDKNKPTVRSQEKEKLLDSDYGSVSEEEQTHLIKSSTASGENTSESNYGGGGSGGAPEEKRPQFGSRFLKEGDNVYQYNAWDNVEWDEEQRTAAVQIISKQMQSRVSASEYESIKEKASHHWDEFYKVHNDKFYKDRNWLFTEFPELHFNSNSSSAERLPKSKTVFEIGCGVGNTVFPLLQQNADPELHVYCCDFSETAVGILRENAKQLDETRCTPFVLDVTSDEWSVPFEEGSLDVVIMIFVLSSVEPSRMEEVLKKVYRYLRPGGLVLFRDYGRYDLSQLRFKDGHCISDNFYVRGEKTLVYFFDREEVGRLYEKCGYRVEQSHCDRRLQLNRRKQLKMYRIWIQGKFRKPES